MHPSAMAGLAQPDDRLSSSNPEDMDPAAKRAPGGAVGDTSKTNRALEEAELDSALQLLVERALYITGATGAALALPQGNEMVCRASAGTSAPAVGMRLQVISGLTGESIARRQLLRCDNAETDPRVNLEACREMGIASIVVLPLFRQNDEVRGLIELFSDHPYAFEERDLVALERMADLTSMALDLAEQRRSSAPSKDAMPSATPVVAPNVSGREQQPPIETVTGNVRQAEELRSSREAAPREVIARGAAANQGIVRHSISENNIVKNNLGRSGTRHEVHAREAIPQEMMAPEASAQEIAVIPDSMRRMQKCTECGFPISEGRTVCLDCERKKQRETGYSENKRAEEERRVSSGTLAPAAEEFIPAFLANAPLVKESWLANHVNLLAIVVLILGILVAIVVFR